MCFELREVPDWTTGISCTPTALAAISGRSLSAIGLLLRQAASERGAEIARELRQDYNINDWLRSVELMGGSWTESQTFDGDFDRRPSIERWMRDSATADLVLVFADNGDGIAHVFATELRMVVDTYTEGRRVPFGDVPSEIKQFRVKRVFRIT